MEYSSISIEKLTSEGACRIALITLSRPEAANALNTHMATELAHLAQQLAAPPVAQQYHVVIITGAGERAFCSGADLKERRGMDKAAWDAQHHALEAAIHAVAALPMPVIAMVQAAAYAGGLELALACDIILAADSARFAFTEASLGIMPGLGGTQRLPRAIDQRAALEMLYLAQPITAQRAEQLGLVNRTLPLAELRSSALTMAQVMAKAAPLSLRAIKRSVSEGLEKPLAQGLACELDYYNQLIATADRIEGINAHNEKRPPHFMGE